MTLLRELIDIPERVGGEDFVLRLVDGVTDERAAATLADYVITDEVAGYFDQALSVIRSALGISVGPAGELREGNHHPGRAVYLHGSFGSGKSHFMAVLHLLLRGDHAARSRPELASAVARHGPWMQGRRFLLLPYHMLGARSIEERLYDGYLQTVRRLHPDAPPPHLFNADAILENAETLRRQLGDEAFLRLLGESTEDEGWGDLDGAWTQESYEAARDAPHDAAARQHLVSVLIERVFPATAATAGDVTPIDQGLEVMTRHAKGLGYDALILFLDELILWLATRAGDEAFIGRETEKLTLLVEAQHMSRDIPVVSFVARQRDLRELVGRGVTGAQELAIDDRLAYQEGRFTRIELSTADLPEIASKRLVRPRDAAAAQALNDRFEQAVGGNDRLLAALTGEQHTKEDFRKVYPFSPILVDTLVKASSMLQRDRTALRAMLQLLVNRRDTLEVGEIIPVGDLYDVISRGNEAITPAFQKAFERARKLYDDKFIPLLERTHRVGQGEIESRDWSDPLRTKWRADDRVMKTLLLGTLVSGVPELEHLTADRIANLNHGSIQSIIPGTEAREVLNRVRAWASEITEIHIAGDDQNPTISVALTGIDIEGILRNVAAYDSHGNRVQLLKEIVFRDLDAADEPGGAKMDLEWQGTVRSAHLVFGNVGELPLATLENDGTSWKVIVDYPIDDDPGGAAKDRAKIAEFRERGRPAQTLIWRPAFLNERARTDLGRLVRLERVLRSDQTFDEAASHLSAAERAQAKPMLQSQRETLRTRVAGYLRAAYALSTEEAFTAGLDHTIEIDEHFVSLDDTFVPRPPAAGSSLKAGLEDLLRQALAAQYPAAPRWEKRVRPADVRRTFEIARRALAANPPRVPVDTAEARLMRHVAVPLRLGDCTSAFSLGDFWLTHFNQHVARAGGGHPTVGDVRRWMDEPEARGLPREVQDLLVLVYAEQSERAILRHGTPLEAPAIGGLQPDDELRQVPLPAEGVWKEACTRAGAIFGETGELFRTGAYVTSLARRIRGHVRNDRGPVHQLAEDLRTRTPADWLTSSNRLRDAEAFLALCDDLETDDDKKLIERLAEFTIEAPTSAPAIGAARAQAEEVSRALRRANWTLLNGLSQHPDPRAPGLVENLRRLLTSHAHVDRLQDELPRLERQAAEIMVAAPSVAPSAPPPPTPPTPDLTTGGAQRERRAVTDDEDVDAVAEALRRALAEHAGSAIDVEWSIRGGDDA